MYHDFHTPVDRRSALNALASTLGRPLVARLGLRPLVLAFVLGMLLIPAWLAAPAAASGREAAPPGTSIPSSTPEQSTPVEKAAADESVKPKEAWYTIELSGSRVGWSKSVRTSEGDRITTESVSEIGVARGAVNVSVKTENSFVETADGKAVSMRSKMAMADRPTVRELTFGETDIAIVSTTGETVLQEKRPLPEGEWLTPAAAERYLEARLKAGAKEVVVRTLDPQSGVEVITTTYKNIKPARMEHMGAEIDGFVCEVTISNQMVKATQWMDASGELIRMELDLGKFKMVTRASTREQAMQKREEAPEVMLETFITPDKPIKDPRSTAKAVYTLSVEDGELPALPTTGTQSVEQIDVRSIRVTVNAAEPALADKLDAARDEFTKPSPTINSDDEKVRELAEKALRDHEDESASRRAERLRRAVHKHITKKNLGVGFATASEVARDGAGDCTEHGVLLAAMLRASGIPARVATGVIYADQFAGRRQIFGYHMWAQALLPVKDGHAWVDLDATLDDLTPYDATHIALGVTSLADGDLERSMMSMASSLGRLRIAVGTIEHAHGAPGGKD